MTNGKTEYITELLAASHDKALPSQLMKFCEYFSTPTTSQYKFMGIEERITKYPIFVLFFTEKKLDDEKVLCCDNMHVSFI